MTETWAVSHTALVALVRGLQFATFVTWASVVFTRGGSLNLRQTNGAGSLNVRLVR